MRLLAQQTWLVLACAGLAAARRLFVFGLGYCGTAVAQSLRAQGWSVAGTCTTAAKAEALREAGVDAFVFNDDDDDDDGDGNGNGEKRKRIRSALAASTHLLSTVPPTQVFASAAPPFGGSLYESADAVLHVFGDCIRSREWVWAGYLSSTGVYGDRAGGWVSEQDAPAPDKPKAIARAQAEQSWMRLVQSVHVFRLAGIYGPGRSALDTLAKAGGDYWACAPDNEQLVSRIHVQDICAVLQASMVAPQPGTVYNVADDEPATRAEVLAFACGLLGVARRGAGEGGDDVVPGRGVGVRGGSKRVSNAKMRELLQRGGGRLEYPTYREGLTALWSGYLQQKGPGAS